VNVRRALRLFLVEDSADVRRRILELLWEIGGVEVVWAAESVGESREVLAHLHLDLALVDLRLPDGSGLDVLGMIRGCQADATVIVLTALETPQMRRACLDAGADYFLGKSSLGTELPALLRGLSEGDVARPA